MKPSDSLTIHGRENPAPDSDVKFCLNCEADAMYSYSNSKGGKSFLCATCADAFELGQTYPDVGLHLIDEEEEEEEDESGNEDTE